MEYYVEIVRYGDEEVVTKMGPMSERKADRVDSGANMNLNHDGYFTRIVEATNG
jgi:hypothetical protein